MHNKKMRFRMPVMLAVIFALVFVGCTSAQPPEPEPVAEAPTVDYPYFTPEQCAGEADLLILGQITGKTAPFTNKTDRAHPTTSEYCAWTLSVSEVYSGSTDKTELTICDHAALSERFPRRGDRRALPE